MNMRVRPHAAAGLLLVASLSVACDSEEQVSDSCLLSPSIGFEGREYIAVDSLSGPADTEIRVGKRVGTGEAASCPGQVAQEVQVFRVVGIPVAQAVFSEPRFGLMARWNQDGAIE